MTSSTALARVIVDELVRCGVREAVLCPGSRNAPLAFALYDADAVGALRLHVRIDERGGGFLALGLALRSGRPVPVVCTSGTAVANLHPAALEAAHAGVGLLLVTADRPPEMVGVGASQTIEQRDIFGPAVRASLTLGPVEAGDDGHGRWRATVDRLVAAARGALTGDPGPAHLNVPLREPLVPDGPASKPDAGRWALPWGRGVGPWTAVARVRTTLPELPLDPAAPTLVLGGHDGHGVPPAHVPLVAEPSSPLWPRSLRTGAWLLGAALSGAAPDLLPRQAVVLGRPTLHRSVQRLLADQRVTVFAVPQGRPGARPTWCDTTGRVAAVGALPEAWTPPPDFGARWDRADAAVAAVLDRSLDGEIPGAPRSDTGSRTDPVRLARDVAAALPPGSLLVAGPSSPVRDLALGACPRPDVLVLSNRGVAGIDGVVSTAVGAALAHEGPAYALLGDVTLLHDANGLLAGPGEPRPDLTLIVANDDGGSVFTLLEQGHARHARVFERVFGTPHHVDLRALCRALGVEYLRVESLEMLGDTLRPAKGLRLVEVPVDRMARRARHSALKEALEAAAGVAASAPVPRAGAA